MMLLSFYRRESLHLTNDSAKQSLFRCIKPYPARRRIINTTVSLSWGIKHPKDLSYSASRSPEISNTDRRLCFQTLSGQATGSSNKAPPIWMLVSWWGLDSHGNGQRGAISPSKSTAMNLIVISFVHSWWHLKGESAWAIRCDRSPRYRLLSVDIDLDRTMTGII